MEERALLTSSYESILLIASIFSCIAVGRHQLKATVKYSRLKYMTLEVESMRKKEDQPEAAKRS